MQDNNDLSCEEVCRRPAGLVWHLPTPQRCPNTSRNLQRQ